MAPHTIAGSHPRRDVPPRRDRPRPTWRSIARRLSCLTGLYEYAVVDAGLIEHSPVVRVKRPKVSDHSSSTVGLDEKELVKLLEAAAADGLRSAALMTLLALNALRIGEALSRDIDDLTYDFGHLVLEQPLAAEAASELIRTSR